MLALIKGVVDVGVVLSLKPWSNVIYIHSIICQFIIVFKVIWKCFFNTNSSAEHGTLNQLRNRLGCSNVVSDHPKKDCNTCENFLHVVVSGHIIAANLKALRMKAMDEKPMTNTAIY